MTQGRPAELLEGADGGLQVLPADVVEEDVDPAGRRGRELLRHRTVVVVECRGSVTTKTGRPYNNRYCLVCLLKDGKIKELTEYMDTNLVVTTFES